MLSLSTIGLHASPSHMIMCIARDLAYVVSLIGCGSSSGGTWSLAEKHFFNQRGARVSAVAYHRGLALLVAGFTSGVFDLVQV